MNLTTERLVLVPVSAEHVLDIYTEANPEVITYMYFSVSKNKEETEEVVKNFIARREQGLEEVYAITKKSSGEFFGIAGLHRLKDEVPELGIWTKLAAHGHHFGREAIGALIARAKVLNVKKLCYPVDRRNIASRKIPQFYGGRRSVDYLEVNTPDGRMLQEEIYEIEL